jgi:hypothetical protein
LDLRKWQSGGARKSGNPTSAWCGDDSVNGYRRFWSGDLWFGEGGGGNHERDEIDEKGERDWPRMNAGDTDSSDSTRKMLCEIQVASYYRFFEQKETKETKWNSEIYASREETQRLYYEKGRERLAADERG